MTTTATFTTSMGTLKVRLMPEHAPTTVANFVELARGERQWRDPRDGRSKTEPLYDGTIFHRVIPDFMIQGGDPEGSGRGGPGYQFLVTVAATPWLNGKHTIFGEVIEGMDVVKAISSTPTGPQDRPSKDVVIEKLVIEDSA